MYFLFGLEEIQTSKWIDVNFMQESKLKREGPKFDI